jgi:hypothetical protein
MRELEQKEGQSRQDFVETLMDMELYDEFMDIVHYWSKLGHLSNFLEYDYENGNKFTRAVESFHDAGFGIPDSGEKLIPFMLDEMMIRVKKLRDLFGISITDLKPLEAEENELCDEFLERLGKMGFTDAYNDMKDFWDKFVRLRRFLDIEDRTKFIRAVESFHRKGYKTFGDSADVCSTIIQETIDDLTELKKFFTSA